MSFVIESDPTVVPIRDDGSLWPAVFITPDGAGLFADTLTDVVAQVIPGYADADTDAQLELRIDSLATLAGEAQAGIVAAAETELSEDELTALLSDKDALTLEFDVWEADIPLILLATNYFPYNDFIRPSGENIFWLDGHDERTYLLGLQQLGAGELHVTNES